MNQTHRPYITIGPTPANDKELEVSTPCAGVNVWIFAIPIPTILQQQVIASPGFPVSKSECGKFGKSQRHGPVGTPVVSHQKLRCTLLSLSYPLITESGAYVSLQLSNPTLSNLTKSYRIFHSMDLANHHRHAPPWTRRPSQNETNSAPENPHCRQDTRYICKPHYNLDYKMVNSSR